MSDVDDEIANLEAGIASGNTNTGPSDEAFPFPGLQYLGCGYNVFGKYASVNSIKGQLFDFSNEKMVKEQFLDRSLTGDQISQSFTSIPPEIKLCYSRFQKVQYKPVFHATIEYQSSGSMMEEQQKMSAQAALSADYGAFGGELSVRYDTTNTRLATTKYYSATAINQYYELTMGNFPSPRLHPEKLPLDEIFKADLYDKNIDKKIAPKDLFDTYGTHYLSAITIGCRIVYGHTVDTSKAQTTYDAEADMKAKYEGVGVSAGGSMSDNTQKESDFEKISIKMDGLDAGSDDSRSQGGEKGDKGESALPLSLLKGGWHNPVLIDFPEGAGALVPIWWLCTDEARRSELEDYFNKTYVKDNGGVAIAAIAAPDLVPLYLLHRTDDPTCVYYRLSRNVHQPEEAIGQWKAVRTDPWFYAFVEQQPGTVPIYEYYCDNPSTCAFRYETGSWDTYLRLFNKRWVKNSSTPLGYVYDGIASQWVYDGCIGEPPKGRVPVYAYYRKSCAGDHFGCYYSTDSADSRDNGGWRPMQIPADDGNPLVNWNADEELAIITVLDQRSNVHWMGPPLSAS